MTQVTFGLQLGGQAYSQIIFFQDKRAFDEYTSGNFEFGADVGAVAITAGASAKTGSAGSSAGAPARSTEPRDALRRCLPWFAGIALFSACVNVLYLTSTLYMLQVYDRVLPSRSMATLVALSLLAHRQEKLLVGSCAVEQDVQQAVVLATLAALNRIMGGLPTRVPTEYVLRPTST